MTSPSSTSSLSPSSPIRRTIRAGCCMVAVLALNACSSSGDDATVATTPLTVTSSTPASTTPSTVATTPPPTTTLAPTTVPATSSSTSPTTLAPTTTIDPIEAGKTAYFLISSTYNAALDAINAKYGSISNSEARDYCADTEAIEQQWIDNLQATTWPDDAQDEIDAMILASSFDVQDLHSCATAATGSAALAILASSATQDHFAKAGDAATAVRVALGLPATRD